MQPSPTFSGPRRVLLSGSVLYLLAAMLPWYRIEGRGFVIEFSGLHELGVLVGILAVYVAVWELLRLTGLPPVDGERGDRFSAVGGLALGVVGAIFVLQRLSEGSLAYGWLVGAVLITAVLAASIVLFSVSGGPEALATIAGLRDREPDDGPPPPSLSPRPRPRTPTAAELAEPGADRAATRDRSRADRPAGAGRLFGGEPDPGTARPGAAWTGSPYARGAAARGEAAPGATGRGAPPQDLAGRGGPPQGAAGQTGPPPAAVPLVAG
ncbi:MAG: hypothetical protein Q7T67_05740, partial [Patulibacter sp.]|nr:hypothetical protein [Patulibacter sp.]